MNLLGKYPQLAWKIRENFPLWGFKNSSIAASCCNFSIACRASGRYGCCPIFGLLEQPLFAPLRVGEGAFLIAEEFASVMLGVAARAHQA
jgi:hypothetical protein